jgi:diadenosine tetraphosphatase ApaH/serine/threonine PP2A family protein phosphatase
MSRGPLPCVRNGIEPFDLVHGSPLDEDEYLITPGDVSNLGKVLTHLTFFGHTHVQGGFLRSHRGAVKRIPAEGTLEVEAQHVFLVNPGSVGQPRDRDPRAAYVLYSPTERAVEYRRAAYDIDKAAGKIRAAGLPERLAARLYEGS